MVLIYFSIYTYYKHFFSRLAFMFSKLGIYGKLKWPLFNFLNWGMHGPFYIKSLSFFSFSSHSHPGELGSYKVKILILPAQPALKLLQAILALMALSICSFPKQSTQVPLNSEKKLLIPWPNQKKNTGILPEWRSTVWGLQGPSRSKTCTPSSKVYDPFVNCPPKRPKFPIF